eukprot:1617537-Amphidinium_carterae.2
MAKCQMSAVVQHLSVISCTRIAPLGQQPDWILLVLAIAAQLWKDQPGSSQRCIGLSMSSMHEG